jgi:hypothetical protein
MIHLENTGNDTTEAMMVWIGLVDTSNDTSNHDTSTETGNAVW